MYEVSVDETFAAAHHLRNYKGKCEDLHGHNYKVRVTLAGAELDATGLLYDFVHLKQVIQGVIRTLDHKYLNELKPFDVLNPSAENIARHIYEQTAQQMRAFPHFWFPSSGSRWDGAGILRSSAVAWKLPSAWEWSFTPRGGRTCRQALRQRLPRNRTSR
jgi:6-pyruvoyltetrahydropterin/6-carboxytetrahydropterin synthase